MNFSLDNFSVRWYYILAGIFSGPVGAACLGRRLRPAALFILFHFLLSYLLPEWFPAVSPPLRGGATICLALCLGIQRARLFLLVYHMHRHCFLIYGDGYVTIDIRTVVFFQRYFCCDSELMFIS